MIPCKISFGPSSSQTSFPDPERTFSPPFSPSGVSFSLIPANSSYFIVFFAHSLFSSVRSFLLLSAINSILNNETWYQKKNVIDFISRVGRQIRLGDMLSRASVKERIKSEEGMSFSEFSYQIFQAYDWLYLRDKYNCCIQVIYSARDSGYDLTRGMWFICLPESSGGRFRSDRKHHHRLPADWPFA